MVSGVFKGVGQVREIEGATWSGVLHRAGGHSDATDTRSWTRLARVTRIAFAVASGLVLAVGGSSCERDIDAMAEELGEVTLMDPAIVDVGVISHSEEIDLAWRVRNGRVPMAEVRVVPTCGCTRASLEPGQLAAGEVALLKATIMREAAGPFRVSLRVVGDGTELVEAIVVGVVAATAQLAVVQCESVESGIRMRILYASDRPPREDIVLRDKWATRDLRVIEGGCWSPCDEHGGANEGIGCWMRTMTFEFDPRESRPVRPLLLEVGDVQASVDLQLLCPRCVVGLN